MVVLSVGIVASAKTLLARQYVEMTRLRVDGLFSAFPKLVDSGRDHTFIETETVRYVYQPMETLHLLLITNKASNILEDLETLRLLAKVVQDCCQLPVNEELVTKNVFDIIFAFDEVISFGYRESVTLAQIKTYTEMDSHEEKLHQMLEQSKINEAREQAKKKQQELSKLRASQPKDAVSMTSIAGPAPGSSPSSQETMGTPSTSNAAALTASLPPAHAPAAWSGSMGAAEDGGASTIQVKSAPKKGMMLGKKKPVDMMSGLGPAEPAAPAAAAVEQEAEAPAAAVVNPLLDPVRVVIEEKISAKLQLEGGLNGEVDLTGQFQVTVLDASKGDLACFKLCAQNPDYKYKVHPNLNKQSYASSVLEVRDAKFAFKQNQPAPLLKWNRRTSDESFLPVTLSCWPTSTSDGTTMVLELELTDDSVVLEDIHIRFPVSANARPQIANAEPGQAQYDQGAEQVYWYIQLLDKNEPNGTFEFSANADAASMLPYTFDATRRGQTKCPMDITECYHQGSKDQVSYACDKSSQYALVIDN